MNTAITEAVAHGRMLLKVISHSDTEIERVTNQLKALRSHDQVALIGGVNSMTHRDNSMEITAEVVVKSNTAFVEECLQRVLKSDLLQITITKL